MDTHKSAADRIRPILQAMENSINTARRTRVKEPVSPAPATPAAPLRGTQPPPGSSTSPQRLKARPKRLESPFINKPFDQAPYRSQAS
jgi:hypothetical protein